LRNVYEDGITHKDARHHALLMKEEALRADILVLDDIGKDDTSSSRGDRRTLSYFGRALYEIIEGRQGQEGLVTVYTSEFALSDPALAERLTESIVNRLADRSEVIGDAPRVRYRIWREREETRKGMRFDGAENGGSA
jgi:DNA replication protein DnaC